MVLFLQIVFIVVPKPLKIKNIENIYLFIYLYLRGNNFVRSASILDIWKVVVLEKSDMKTWIAIWVSQQQLLLMYCSDLQLLQSIIFYPVMAVS